MIYCRCSIHKHIVQNESTRGKTKIILLTLEMARQEVSRTTHIEEGELRVTHENAILTNITPSTSTPFFYILVDHLKIHNLRRIYKIILVSTLSKNSVMHVQLTEMSSAKTVKLITKLSQKQIQFSLQSQIILQ